MELEQVDGLDAKFLADLISVFEDVVWGKDVEILICRECGPLVVGGRDFRSGVEALFVGGP